MLVQQGKRGEAIKEYLSAMREFPHHPGTAGLLCDLGLAYEFSKKEDKAQASYLKALPLKLTREPNPNPDPDPNPNPQP